MRILLFLCLFGFLSANDAWYTETLYEQWGQTFEIDEVLYEIDTDEQHLIIFENTFYGRVLALDGIIQTTERDEFIYHEMMTHVPLLSHSDPRSILVIGGGDGGAIREVLRHRNVEKVTLVEIDRFVIELSKQYLPNLSKGAFEDPRLDVVIADGCQFVKESQEKFDVIIIDSTDPIGPGEVLFTSEFYGDCHFLLNQGGILVTQGGVPFLQDDEFIKSYPSRSAHFEDVTSYLAVIPTYVGGFMAMGWASDDSSLREVSIEELVERLRNVEGSMHYYTPALHKAAFSLPKFMEDHVGM